MFFNYTAPLSSVLRTLPGTSARHMLVSGVINPVGAVVDDVWWTSSCSQGCPIPAKQSAFETIGHGELLLPLLYQTCIKEKAKLKDSSNSWITLDWNDVEALELGLAYYDMGATESDYRGRDCKFVPWSALFEDATHYFKEVVGSTPNKKNPSPELEILRKQLGEDGVKCGDGDGGSSGSKDKQGPNQRLGERLPPGAKYGWYYVVRIVPKADSTLKLLVGDMDPVSCQQQIVLSSSNGFHEVWLMGGAKIQTTSDLAFALRDFEGKRRSSGSKL